MQRKTIIGTLCALLMISSLSACGKRGDPFRPSEIPNQQSTS